MCSLIQIPSCCSRRAPGALAFPLAPDSDASLAPDWVPDQKPPAVLPLAPSAMLHHYRIAVLSRQVSQLGQREVFSGRAKFGVFGAGKEVAQVALAHVFRPGDFRAGYYRDQTLLFALGLTTPEAFFAQLYAHADVVAEPASGGRSMVSHFATRLLDDAGHWQPQTDRYHSSADVSSTAGQMPRLVGLAYASRLYREVAELQQFSDFSCQGNEIAFGTIGNASCAQGMFWEAINAIGVLQSPAVISIWDDEYGISVPNAHQFLGGDLTALLAGFRRQPGSDHGFDLYRVHGWDYPALLTTYAQAATNARQHHIPAIVHVIEMTQPQGHSTSGSHERYKSAERLAWEAAHDPIPKLRAWLLAMDIATEADLTVIEQAARQEAEAARDRAWQATQAPLQAEAIACAKPALARRRPPAAAQDRITNGAQSVATPAPRSRGGAPAGARLARDPALCQSNPLWRLSLQRK
jgi:TPP-dependent pyruvate/acetoin dehydrogenase alpha subunit